MEFSFQYRYLNTHYTQYKYRLHLSTLISIFWYIIPALVRIRWMETQYCWMISDLVCRGVKILSLHLKLWNEEFFKVFIIKKLPCSGILLLSFKKLSGLGKHLEPCGVYSTLSTTDISNVPWKLFFFSCV